MFNRKKIAKLKSEIYSLEIRISKLETDMLIEQSKWRVYPRDANSMVMDYTAQYVSGLIESNKRKIGKLLIALNLKEEYVAGHYNIVKIDKNKK